jgi:hypothetical protein
MLLGDELPEAPVLPLDADDVAAGLVPAGTAVVEAGAAAAADFLGAMFNAVAVRES